MSLPDSFFAGDDGISQAHIIVQHRLGCSLGSLLKIREIGIGRGHYDNIAQPWIIDWMPDLGQDPEVALEDVALCFFDDFGRDLIRENGI